MKGNQEVFDYIVKHVIKQGKPSLANMQDGDACQYRNVADDLSCAIGCLIPDKLYDHSIEGLDFADLVTQNGALRNYFVSLDASFVLLADLQKSHDEASESYVGVGGVDIQFVDRFIANVCDVAKDHGLELPQEVLVAVRQ